MRKVLAVFLTVLCGAVVFSASAQAQQAQAQARQQVSVFVIGVTKENEKKALGNEINYALIKSGRYAAAERANDYYHAMFAEQQSKQRVDDLRVREIAKSLGLSFVCIADVTDVHETYQVAARIVNVEAAEVITVGKTYNGLKSIGDLTEAANKIIESMFNSQQQRRK